jgi:hypothetical protein
MFARVAGTTGLFHQKVVKIQRSWRNYKLCKEAIWYALLLQWRAMDQVLCVGGGEAQ